MVRLVSDRQAGGFPILAQSSIRVSTISNLVNTFSFFLSGSPGIFLGILLHPLIMAASFLMDAGDFNAFTNYVG